MGHKIQRKAYRLKFADGSDLDGATVMLGSLSIGQLRSLAGLNGVKIGGEDFGKILDTTADRLIGWDLEEEDGTPIPATKQGLESLDADLVIEIIQAWTEAVGRVEAPLPEGSPSGAISPEVSIPMTPIDSSPSLAS